jgi:hypothetical protein
MPAAQDFLLATAAICSSAQRSIVPRQPTMVVSSSTVQQLPAEDQGLTLDAEPGPVPARLDRLRRAWLPPCVPPFVAFTFRGSGDVASVTGWLSRRQARRTPQRGVVASFLYGVVAVLDLTGYFSFKEDAWMLVSGLCLAALCVTTLASAMSLHRRNKNQAGQRQV